MRVQHLLLLVVFMTLLGCSTKNVDFELVNQPIEYVDQYVEKSALQIYVKPSHALETPPTALFIPFRVTQKIEDATVIGENISQQIWATWLQAVVFPVIEWSPMQAPYRQDMALALGRARGADYVVGGVITYLMDGGAVGDSYISVKVDIHNVKTGDLMWSMAQSGMMRQKAYKDYIIFSRDYRMPTDPLAIVVQSVAMDMANAIKNIDSPESKGYPEGDAFQENFFSPIKQWFRGSDAF